MYLSTTQKKIAFATITLITIALLYWLMTKPSIEPLPEMTVAEKKARFKKLLVPAVDKVYQDLEARYQKVAGFIEQGTNAETIAELKAEYKATTDQALLAALKPHPRSIALAQAAMESSWATSRFFRAANNVFGVWSFDENEPRIAAGEQRGDKTIYVKKYRSIEAAVKDYYRTLGRSHAFQEFRNTRLKTADPFILVTKLDRYSEKGAHYGKELSEIIKFNKFTDYDK